MNKVKTRALAETSALTALSIVLALLSLIVPIFHMIAVFLVPVVLMVIGARSGLRWSILSFIVTMVLAGAGLGLLWQVVLELGPASIGALVIVLCWQKEWHYTWMLTLPPVVTTVLMLGAMWAALAAVGTSPLALFADNGADFVNKILDAYRSMGLSSAQLANMEATIRPFIEQMLTVFVGAAYVAMLIVNFITIKIAGAIMRRLHIHAYEVPDFVDWHVSQGMLYITCVAILIWYAGTQWQMQWLALVGNNLLEIGMAFLFIDGLVVLWNWLSGYSRSGWIKGLLVIIALYASYGVMVLGAIDLLRPFNRERLRFRK